MLRENPDPKEKLDHLVMTDLRETLDPMVNLVPKELRAPRAKRESLVLKVLPP